MTPLRLPALSLLPLLLALAATRAAAADPGYTAHELAGPGGHSVWANAISARGEVVGRGNGESAGVGSAWSVAVTPDGHVSDFQPLGTLASEATGVNAAGAVVGYAFFPQYSNFHSYLHRADDSEIDLFADVPRTLSVAYAVNAAGTVVGYFRAPGQPNRPFVWRNGHHRSLGNLGGGDAWATSVNDAGVIVGSGLDAQGYVRAFRYRAGTMENLGSLGADDYESRADTIGPDGTVVGACQARDLVYRPCVWPGGAPVTGLPMLPGDRPGGEAFSVNASRDIVGAAMAADGNFHATLWRDGHSVDLNAQVVDLPAGVVLKAAVAINDGGAIVVHGIDAAKVRRHFVLVPQAVN